MASTKPGPVFNLEEDPEGSDASIDGSIFIPDTEATTFLVSYSHFHDRDIDSNPYFHFSGPISDSYTDSEPDPYNYLIDFFDRESSEVNASEYLESEGLTSDDFNIWGLYDPKEDEEIVLGTRSEPEHQFGDSGLRVTGMDSDSDYDDGVFDLTSEENDSGGVEVGTALSPVWDQEEADEEWEEVQNAINWTVRAFSRPQEEEEELSSSPSRISSNDFDDDDQEEGHELDWQVLLTVNNVVNYIEQAEGILINTDDIDPSYYLYLASLDAYDDNYNGIYDDSIILGQMFDNETGIMGNPPAAKRVVEDLPAVELTVDELKNGNLVCAVCKDEMVAEEKVRRLPCKHIYHGECIMPWLGIRNTCPVCRFELPTDDLEYESHKRSPRNDNIVFLAG